MVAFAVGKSAGVPRKTMRLPFGQDTTVLLSCFTVAESSGECLLSAILQSEKGILTNLIMIRIAIRSKENLPCRRARTVNRMSSKWPCVKLAHLASWSRSTREKHVQPLVVVEPGHPFAAFQAIEIATLSTMGSPRLSACSEDGKSRREMNESCLPAGDHVALLTGPAEGCCWCHHRQSKKVDLRAAGPAARATRIENPHLSP